MITISSGPRTRRPRISHWPENATGYLTAMVVSMSGRATWSSSQSWAMPIVATSKMTLGARNNRVITVSSEAAATRPPAITATMAAGQKGQS